MVSDAEPGSCSAWTWVECPLETLPAFGVRLLAFGSGFRPAQNSLIRRVCLSRSFSLSRSRGASSRFSIPKPKLNVQLIPESARRKSCGTPQFANLAADSSTGTQTSGLDPRMRFGLIAFGRRLMWLETRVGDRGWPNKEIVGPSFWESPRLAFSRLVLLRSGNGVRVAMAVPKRAVRPTRKTYFLRLRFRQDG